MPTPTATACGRENLKRLIMQIELTRRCASHGRPIAALIVGCALPLCVLERLLRVPSACLWGTAAAASILVACVVALSYRAQVSWEQYVFSLMEHPEPESFPALLDALFRTEQLTVTRPEAEERLGMLTGPILAALRYHLDRPQTLAGIRLRTDQQERLHMALMSDHRDLVLAILRAMPFLADDDSATYVGKLAAGSWAAEYDGDLQLAAARMLPCLGE